MTYNAFSRAAADVEGLANEALKRVDRVTQTAERLVAAQRDASEGSWFRAQDLRDQLKDARSAYEFYSGLLNQDIQELRDRTKDLADRAKDVEASWVAKKKEEAAKRDTPPVSDRSLAAASTEALRSAAEDIEVYRKATYGAIKRESWTPVVASLRKLGMLESLAMLERSRNAYRAAYGSCKIGGEWFDIGSRYEALQLAIRSHLADLNRVSKYLDLTLQARKAPSKDTQGGSSQRCPSCPCRAYPVPPWGIHEGMEGHER